MFEMECCVDWHMSSWPLALWALIACTAMFSLEEGTGKNPGRIDRNCEGHRDRHSNLQPGGGEGL
jgi:hypothetical protein